MHDIGGLLKVLSEETGIPFSAERGVGSDGDRWMSFVPAGFRRANTFSIRLKLKFRRLEFELIPGEFAADFIAGLSRTDRASQIAFVEVLADCKGRGARISLLVNNQSIEDLTTIPWQDHWTRFGLILNKGNLEIGTEDGEPDFKIILPWIIRFVAALVSLLPLEEIDQKEVRNTEGLPEGAKLRVEINKYERDRRNRAAALAIHGYSCAACDLNFSERYGDVAAGFIEVHHVVPVSEMGEGYIVNPTTDLVPLCSNCHSVVHKRSPPYSVLEIKDFLNTRSED